MISGEDDWFQKMKAKRNNNIDAIFSGEEHMDSSFGEEV